jgi:integrase
MSENYQKLAESIAIYKPNKNCRVWWMRARIDKKELRKSTQQRNKDEAIKTAWSMYSNFQERKKQGLVLTSSKKLSSLSSQIIEEMEKKGTSKDQMRVFRVLLEEWGTKNVEDLTSKDVQDLYRKKEVSGTPKENYYKMTLKTVFDFLALNNIVKRGFLPDVPKLTKRKRASFDILTSTELKALLFHFEWLVDGCSKILKKDNTRRNLRTFEKYRLTAAYLNLLAETGARAGKELLNLRLSDIEMTKKDVGIVPNYKVDRYNIHIKNGKMSERTGTRRIPAPPLFSQSLNSLFLDIHGKSTDELKIINKDMFIFSLPHKPDKPIFPEIILKENIRFLQKNGTISPNKKIAPYSLRHTFITHSLCQGIDIFLLSELCGNSVGEIQRTYSRFSSIFREEEIWKIDIFNNNIDI